MYLLTYVFCYFFLFSPSLNFFSSPDPEFLCQLTARYFCFLLLLETKNKNIPLPKKKKPCSSETNLPFNINHLENFIIHQPISPFPAGTLPFLVVDDLCNLALPFDSLPLPCPSAALLCCSLKRVTPQCLFILFGMLLFTLFITLFFIYLRLLFLILQKCTVCSLPFFECIISFLHCLLSLLFNLVCLYFMFSFAWFIALHVFYKSFKL